MCGIAGLYRPEGGQNHGRGLLQQMADALAHRGPDDSGVWEDAEAGIGLAHRRLSIVDLSPAGHQPMASASGRYVLVFNGEIYNHALLRRDTGLTEWRGHSDTETLLAGFEAWGIEPTVRRAVGMFSFAVWDREARTLTLGRDRLGEKPLYYGWQGKTFLFGSELKALKEHPAFEARVDRNALALFMRYSYIPAPHSIYQGVRKLLPGALLTISDSDRQPAPVRYWDARQVVAEGLAHPHMGSSEEIVNDLEQVLLDSVAQQMVADVPLGAFLSGGVDSSTVVALMQAQSTRPVRTFSIGFHEPDYNEAEYAKGVASHLGTDHTELYVTAEEAMAVVPRLPQMYCEPFADSSQIPTFLVSELARRHVTVSLSGDGGDELFGGYNRYVLAWRLWGKLSRAPLGLRRLLGKGLAALSPEAWNRLLGPVQSLLPQGLAQANIGDKLHKGAGPLAARTPLELYGQLVSQWADPEAVVLGSREPAHILSDSALRPKTDCFVHDMMAMDLVSYLPGDILAKVDRAAMGVSLESRVPLLDHRVVEFAWSLPLGEKLKQGVGKWPLRQVLYKYVPRELIERPKVGFGIPVGAWLRGPMRDWAEALLDESRLRREGYFAPRMVRAKWSEHLSGQRNWQHGLWNVLMFQAWLEVQCWAGVSCWW